MYLIKKIITFLVAILPVCAIAMPTTGKFLSFSDIHFTPFANCATIAIQSCPFIDQLRKAPVNNWEDLFEKNNNQKIAGYTHDTSYALLKSSLQELKVISQQENLAFTLILGDFLAHNFHGQYIYYSHDRSEAGYQLFVKKTLEFLTREIRTALPQGDIYPVVGNNDSYTGDYSVVSHGAFLRDTATTWSHLIKDDDNKQSLLSTFPSGGYYAVDVPSNKKQRILILNTVLFSTSSKEAVAANTQLAWLHQQLTLAAKQHTSVILAFHIPVGIDVYKTVARLLGGVKQFWHAEYGAAFEHELRLFPETVRAILPGHIHMDSFQVIGLNQLADIPISFTPSISPIFGNNPGFKVYHYDKNTFTLIDYDMYFYPLNTSDEVPHWQHEYAFKHAYQSTCQHCNIAEEMKKIKLANKLAFSYKQYYGVGSLQPIAQPHNWSSYWCDIFTITETDFQTCVHH